MLLDCPSGVPCRGAVARTRPPTATPLASTTRQRCAESACSEAVRPEMASHRRDFRSDDRRIPGHQQRATRWYCRSRCPRQVSRRVGSHGTAPVVGRGRQQDAIPIERTRTKRCPHERPGIPMNEKNVFRVFCSPTPPAEAVTTTHWGRRRPGCTHPTG